MRALDSLVGARCWHLSAGGPTAPSFLLVMGAQVPRERPLRNPRQPRAFRLNRGSIELLVWCSWRLQTSRSVLASSDQLSAGLRELRRLIGKRVLRVSCTPPAWDLRLEFTGGLVLAVFSNHVAPYASIDQNWELWLPNRTVRAGPGQKWEESPVSRRSGCDPKKLGPA